MGVTSTLLRRVPLLLAAGLVASAPLLLFVGSANANNLNPPPTTRKNAGTPNSTIVVKNKAGVVIKYGNKYITYKAPSSKLDTLGQALFLENCASCHGSQADGVPANGTSGAYPDLVGLRPAQAVAIAAWVNSLSASYPDIPTPHLKNANVAEGAALYALNCAACHTIEGDGDALAEGTFSPSLRHIPAFQVVEAIRTGPANMPRFTGNLSDKQVNDITKYVRTEIEHPNNPGGFGLGGLGPVAEGFVGLLIGLGLLMLICYWIGDRS